MITEAEARAIRDGILSGDVDEIDLLGIAEDVAAWVGESDSHTATAIRARRWEHDNGAYV